MNAKDEARFWSKVNKTEACWEWTGCQVGKDAWRGKGYAGFSIESKTKIASRVIWEHLNGTIPIGLQVCHSCDNPNCVRPDHLYLGTNEVNQQDSKVKGRTCRGKSKPFAKLSEDDVRTIWEKHLQGFGTRTLSKAYGVNRKTIHDIFKGRAWTHITNFSP